MIGPKVAKPTAAAERDAYEIATLRDADTCQRCRRYCGPTARDHRKNRSQGGQTVASNLCVLGLGCHMWKTENPEDAVDDGWAVPGWPRADWRQWPARRWVKHPLGYLDLVWVLLDDVGGWEVIDETDARERMRQMGWEP
ncbi:HNH endonuclease [Agromyces aureus]|uniref:HNH nuclease domain-containing protein n=1 Tax=Agromyces aureus TaxID=453304 RepID=A0A191WF39_9MICO|nr:hypothetical protein [Agromyces aureus]ANJ26794.1 hypothetical protein ATC03_08775 [Agromyces aureus]